MSGGKCPGGNVRIPISCRLVLLSWRRNSHKPILYHVLQPAAIRGLAASWIIFLQSSIDCCLQTDLSKRSPVNPVHFVMLSCQRVLGLPLLLWPEVVPCIIFSPCSFFISVAHYHNKKAFFSLLAKRYTVSAFLSTQSLVPLSVRVTRKICLNALISNDFIQIRLGRV